MRKPLGLGLALCAAVATGCAAGSDTAAESTSAPAASSAVSSSITLPPASETPLPAGGACQPFLDKLTIEQKLAQLLTVGVTGTADALNVVDQYQVGGIFIGSGTEESLLSVPANMQQVKAAALEKSNVPLMVTIDEEGGRVSRFPDLLQPGPSAQDIAAAGNPQQSYEAALARANTLKSLGITVNFAPVVDVGTDNAAIGDRSYSDDPQVVVTYAEQYIRAMQAAQVGAVTKHFPGHGRASGDSHTGVVTTPPLDQLTGDLVPYAKLADLTGAVMVGHLVVPGLTDGKPASISPEAMQFLRAGSGYGGAPFDGVIFTDDLSGMAAITSQYSIEDAVEKALEAGADVALWISTDAVPSVLTQLESAVEANRLPLDQVDKSVVRVAKYKGVQLPQGC